MDIARAYVDMRVDGVSSPPRLPPSPLRLPIDLEGKGEARRKETKGARYKFRIDRPVVIYDLSVICVRVATAVINFARYNYHACVANDSELRRRRR